MTPIRFHLDEHVPDAVARGLRRRGIDVTTTDEAGLTAARDIEHVAFALLENRVIVTHDEDFLKLHADGVAHYGRSARSLTSSSCSTTASIQATWSESANTCEGSVIEAKGPSKNSFQLCF